MREGSAGASILGVASKAGEEASDTRRGPLARLALRTAVWQSLQHQFFALETSPELCEGDMQPGGPARRVRGGPMGATGVCTRGFLV